MATEVTTREELHRLIDEMTDDELQDLVDLVNTRLDDDELSSEEMASVEEARKELRRGQTISAEHLRSERKGA